MKRNNSIAKFWIPLFLVGGLLVWAACNKGFDRVLGHKNYEDTTSSVAKNPHVLYIVVDGARGQSVRQAQPPNIMSLTDHAIYSWNDVTDTSSLKVSSWADLLTGVSIEKHGVNSEDLSKSNLENYPVFFKYIKERKPDFRVAAFSSSDSLKSLIDGNGINVNQSMGGDDNAVLNAALKELDRDSTGLVFVEFSGVDKAGAQYGYDISVPQYKAAILEADQSIGKLLAAIRKHKDYLNEQWLVVITSNRGGQFTIPPDQDDHTVLSDPYRNSFVIFYSTLFQPLFIDKPYTGNRYDGNGVELTGSDSNAVRAIIPDDFGDYNFGDSIDFTIEFKIKIKTDGNGAQHNFSSYPSLLSKRKTFDRNVPGWTFWLHDKHWAFLVEQVGGFTEAQGPDISDGTWHDLAAVVVMRDRKRYARIFTDGNFNTEVDITNRGNISSDGPVTLGFLAGIGSGTVDNVVVTDLKIWKAALDDATINKFACETSLSSSHPYNDYLAGYWPCTEGQGGEFVDHSTLQHNFEILGTYQWEPFSDLICAPAASNLAVLMPQPIDMARQIMNWLQIPNDPKWDMDGRVWTTNYVGIKQ